MQAHKNRRKEIPNIQTKPNLAENELNTEIKNAVNKFLSAIK